MEITKSNFQEELPRIKNAVARADFIAIDCELTGLHIGSNISSYDTQALYYEKIKRGAKQFLVIQYGLCMFRYDAEERKFKQQGYNFYVFPRPTNKIVPDRKFLCQASSIDFLISEGFDFNKLFKEGIPYLNSIEEDKYRENLLKKQKVRANHTRSSSLSDKSSGNSGISVSVEDRLKIDDILNLIEAFISGIEEELILPRSNAFIRRLVYGEVPVRFKNRALLETRVLANKDRVLVVTREKSKADMEKENLKKTEEEENEFKACIGFSEIVKYIIESGKLVVGHNMFLDLVHTIEKFLIPLPDDYEEFKQLTSATFLNLLDTKYMSSIEPFRSITDSNVLSHLLESVHKKPFTLPDIEIEESGLGYDLKCNKSHEAGYDAFITGVSFIAMWMYLGKEKHYEDQHDIFKNPTALDCYKNRLYLMKVCDIPCIHLGKKDVVPDRQHVLFVMFPKEWTVNDLTSLFSPFGPINIGWIDDQSAYVGLQSHEKSQIALNMLSQSDRYTVTTYAERQDQLNARKLSHTPRAMALETSNVSLKARSLSAESGNTYKKRGLQEFQVEEDPVVRSAYTLEQGQSTHKKIKKTFNEDIDWS